METKHRIRSHEITIKCNCRSKETLNLLQDPVTSTNNTSLITNKCPNNPNNSNCQQPGNRDLLSNLNNSSSNLSSILVQITTDLKILNLMKTFKFIHLICEEWLKTHTFNQIRDKVVLRVKPNSNNNISHNLYRTNANQLSIALDQVVQTLHL